MSSRVEDGRVVGTAPVRGRPSPAASQDTEFFWQVAADRRLAVQACVKCGALRHPPGPSCPECLSLMWRTRDLSGRGTLYSYTVVHHPRAVGFDGPAVVVLVEMEEGVRIVSNVDEIDPDTLRIGEPLEVYFVDQDEGWTVPQFRRVC